MVRPLFQGLARNRREGRKPETTFLSSLFAGNFPTPRFFGAHHAIELDAGFPKNYFSSLNTQNCGQGINLKGKRRLESWMTGIERVSGQTLKHGFRWAKKGTTR